MKIPKKPSLIAAPADKNMNPMQAAFDVMPAKPAKTPSKVKLPKAPRAPSLVKAPAKPKAPKPATNTASLTNVKPKAKK